MFVLGAAVAPSSASAFVGESQVIKPGSPNTLTGPAKTILEKPTFLPDAASKAASYGGAKEASGFARVMQAGKILPALGGGVLAFGVGAAIGTEICGVLGIEGCWEFSSVNADPVDPSTGEWNFFGVKAPNPFNQEPDVGDFIWLYDIGSGAYYTGAYEGVGGAPCGQPQPGGVSKFIVKEVKEDICSPFGGAGQPEESRAAALRYSMENRTITHNPSDDPEVGNYAYTEPENWPEETAAALEAGDPQTDRVGEKIASEIEGSEVNDPYAEYVQVPSCSGMVWTECKTTVEELELVPQRDELDWQTADIEKSAGAVLDVSPETGTELEVGSTVTVETNPDTEGMPLVVPEPLPQETYSEYITRLAPGLNPTRVTVLPEFTDPDAGPNGVIRTVPESGSRVDPSTETGVDVYTNPADAPVPAAGSWTAPNVPAVDASPLTGISVGCNSFPFGVFCWVADGLGSWSEGSGECPSVTLPFDSYDAELEYDFCTFEPAMLIIRPFIILLSAFGVAWLFAASAIGIGGGEADE